MEILILLIPMSVVLVLLAGGVFLLMNRQGQFDDLVSPAFSILADDDRAQPPFDLDQGGLEAGPSKITVQTRAP